MSKHSPGDRRRGSRRAVRPALSAAARHYDVGRAEPPVPITDDLEEFVAPPLPGKIHPPEEMDEATPTLDDEKRRYRHHPNDAGAVEFGFDPEAADAAADLAGDLGSAFLSGATRGEDMSSVTADERPEDELPLVLDESDEPRATVAPRRAGRGRVRRL